MAIYTTSHNQFVDRLHIAKVRHEELEGYFTEEANESAWLKFLQSAIGIDFIRWNVIQNSTQLS